MNLGMKKDLAARTLKVSPKRVKILPKTEEEVNRVKEALTKDDIRDLFGDGVIKKLPKRGISKTRSKFIKAQKKKGRRNGPGSKRGTKNSRFKRKEAWMVKIRALRKYLQKLRESGEISQASFKELYLKSKSNFFRNKNHMKMFMEQKEMFLEKSDVKVADVKEKKEDN